MYHNAVSSCVDHSDPTLTRVWPLQNSNVVY